MLVYCTNISRLFLCDLLPKKANYLFKFEKGFQIHELGILNEGTYFMIVLYVQYLENNRKKKKNPWNFQNRFDFLCIR